MVTEEEEEKVDRGERVAIYAIKSAPQNCGVGGTELRCHRGVFVLFRV